MRYLINIKIIITFTLAGIFSQIASSAIEPSYFIKLPIDNPAAIDMQGKLNAAYIPAMLAKLHQQGLLKGDDFKDSKCLKAESVTPEGSYFTAQLHKITSTCAGATPSMYVMKESTVGTEETDAFNRIASEPYIKKLMLPQMPPAGNLNVALPVAYLEYEGHHLSLMPFARGRELCLANKEFRDNQTDVTKVDKIKKVYQTLGEELAHFHKLIAKKAPGMSAIDLGLVHGDLHCLNLFYDDKLHLATLIDNASIDDSIKIPALPNDDILKLLLSAYSTTELQFSPARTDFIKGISMQTWIDNAVMSFVEGYTQAYPASMHKAVLQDLRKIFNSDPLPSWFHITPTNLANLRNLINAGIDKKIAATK